MRELKRLTKDLRGSRIAPPHEVLFQLEAGVLTPRQFFRYCPRCGRPYAPTVQDPGNEHQKCAGCQTTVFHNPHPAIIALALNERREVLLARRGIDPGKGMLDVFGGFLEWGEDPIAALEREFGEETGGAEFIPVKFLNIYHHFYPWGSLAISVIAIAYVGRVIGTIRPSDDVAEALWAPLDALPSEDFAFPYLITALEQLHLQLKGKQPCDGIC